MSEIFNYILTLVLLYGYVSIVVLVFFGSLGIPIPITGLMLAAGSFCVDNTLNIYLLIPIAALSALAGDCFGYMIGKRYGLPIVTKILRRMKLTDVHMESMNRNLERWGIVYIFVSRWLITPFGPPLNFVVGMNEYPFKKFFATALCGQFLWAFIYVYLGYVFGASWQALFDYLNDVPQFFAFTILGVGSLVIGWRRWKR